MLKREAIVRTRDAIAAAPDSHFDMMQWGRGVAPSCNSPACFAGFICHANGVFPNENSWPSATKILGAETEDSVRHLFCFCDSVVAPDPLRVSPQDFTHITRQDAIALCNMLIDAADGKRTVESCTWHAVIAARPHDTPKLPDSITDALNEPLLEQPDATFIAEMEAAE